MKYAYFENQIILEKEACVSIKIQGLQYGLGCFTGIRGYWNSDHNELYLFRIWDHYKRLLEASKILMINFKMSFEDFIEVIQDLVQKNGCQENIYIRVFLYKAEKSMLPKLDGSEDGLGIYILGLGNTSNNDSGLRCKVSSWGKVSDHMIPIRAKVSGLYVNSSLAKAEAVLDGYDDCIFLDFRGNVTEGSTENIFILRDGVLLTPPKTSSILEGITRETVIQLLKDLNFSFEEREINRTELYIAEEVFLCGTGVEILWVKEIDRRKVGDGLLGKVTQKIRDDYFKIVYGNDLNYRDWLDAVYH